MEALNFSGSTSFTVNGVAINFLPGDPTWLEEFLAAVERIESAARITEDEQREIDADPKAVFAMARKRDAMIREELDSVFGSGASDAIYKGNMTALSDGLPVWLNWVMLIMEKIEQSLQEQKNLGNPRISKYTAKFTKYQRK